MKLIFRGIYLKDELSLWAEAMSWVYESDL